MSNANAIVTQMSIVYSLVRYYNKKYIIIGPFQSQNSNSPAILGDACLYFPKK